MVILLIFYFFNIFFKESLGFSITYENAMTKIKETTLFDKLIICTGFFSKPNYDIFSKYSSDPSIQLKISHTADYQTPEIYKNKKVIIIGHGHSSIQIAVDLCNIASSVVNVFRNPHWVLPKVLPCEKYHKTLPYDIGLFTTRNQMKEWASKSISERNKIRNQASENILGQNATGIGYIHIFNLILNFFFTIKNL